MIAFQRKKLFRFNEVRKTDKSISTLLVPAHLLKGLKIKTKENGCSLVVYFRNLLWKFRTLTHSGMIHPPRKIKTEYQEEGLDLKRVNFRVGNADWIELGGLALAFGKSRCWMFTYLLELDLLGVWDILYESELSGAVPINDRLELRASWSFKRFSQDFARSYYIRV
jgi:hypothetical protein